MQVSQADQYASTVFVYNLCTVQIMHNIFLVLSLFVLRRLVNSCVKSDIVHFIQTASQTSNVAFNYEISVGYARNISAFVRVSNSCWCWCRRLMLLVLC